MRSLLSRLTSLESDLHQERAGRAQGPGSPLSSVVGGTAGGSRADGRSVEASFRAHIEALKESFQNELTHWASAQRSLEGKVNQLREEFGKQHEGRLSNLGDVPELRKQLHGLEAKLHEEIAQQACLREKDIADVREALAVEARTREAVRDSVRDAVKRHLEDERSARELHNSGFAEIMDNRLAQERASSGQLLGGMKDRLAKLEKVIEESSARQTRDMDAVRDKLREDLQSRLWEYHGSVRDPCAALKERVDHLEEVLGESLADGDLAGDCSPGQVRASRPGAEHRLGSDASPGGRSPTPSLAASQAARGPGGPLVARLQRLEVAERDALGRWASQAHAMSQDLAQCKARCENLEKQAVDAAAKQHRDLQAVQARAEQESKAAASKDLATRSSMDLLRGSLEEHGNKKAALEDQLGKLREALHVHGADVARDKEDVMAHHGSLQDQIAHFQQTLDAAVSNVSSQVDKQQEVFKQHYETVREHLAAEKRSREAHERAMREHLAEERQSSKSHRDALDEHAAMATALKGDTEEKHASTAERLAALECALGLGEAAAEASPASKASPTSRASPSSLAGRSRVPDGSPFSAASKESQQKLVRVAEGSPAARRKAASLKNRFDALETEVLDLKGRRVQDVAEVTKQLTADKDARDRLQKTVADQLGHFAQVETTIRSKADALETLVKHTSEAATAVNEHSLQAAEARIREEVTRQLADERGAREAFHTSVQEHLASERKARAEHHSDTSDHVAVTTSKLAEEVAALKDGVATETHARVQHYEAVQEHLAVERRSREAHEKQMRTQHVEDREARSAHEKMVREHLSNERALRERHQEQVRVHLTNEKAARESGHQRLHEYARGERTKQEEGGRKLQDALAEERSFREQHSESVKDLLERERASRKRLEERFAKERKEVEERHQVLSSGLEDLTRDIAMLKGRAEAAAFERVQAAHDVLSRASRSPTPSPRADKLVAARHMARGAGGVVTLESVHGGRDAALRLATRTHSPLQSLRRGATQIIVSPAPASATAIDAAWADAEAAAGLGAARRTGALKRKPAGDSPLRAGGLSRTSSISAAPTVVAGGSHSHSGAPLTYSSIGRAAPCGQAETYVRTIVGGPTVVSGTATTAGALNSPPRVARAVSSSPMRPCRTVESSQAMPVHSAPGGPSFAGEQLTAAQLSANQVTFGVGYKERGSSASVRGTSAPPAQQAGQQLGPVAAHYSSPGLPHRSAMSAQAFLDGTFLQAPAGPGDEEATRSGQSGYWSGPFWVPEPPPVQAALPAQGTSVATACTASPALPIEARTVHPIGSALAAVSSLMVESPNGHMSCIGEYSLVHGEAPNGFPLWKQKGGERWLYSGTDGRWYIAGADAANSGFACSLGFIHNLNAHMGATPDQIGPGNWVRKYGAEYLEDPAIRITALPDSLSRGVARRLVHLD